MKRANANTTPKQATLSTLWKRQESKDSGILLSTASASTNINIPISMTPESTCTNTSVPNSVAGPSTSTSISNSVAGPWTQLSDSTVLQFRPPHNFKFPSKKCGTETQSRSCQAVWFTNWPWLHYVKEADHILCFYCMQANKLDMFKTSTKADSTFSVTGFSNWRKAVNKINSHERCAAHKEAIEHMAALSQKPITVLLSEAAQRDQDVARRVLYEIFKTVRFLGRQGLPFRGDEHKDGVFWQLLIDRCSDVPDLTAWLNRRNNWCSDNIQNEIIEMFAHSVQRMLTADILASPYYGLVADGTTDQNGKEQFSICLQHVSENLESSCDFLGFYNSPDSTSETLFMVVKDVFIRLGISMDRLRGYCFDGASNMSGRISGLQKRLGDVCEGALYVHCSNHSLDLTLQEVSKEVRLVADTLNFVKGVANVVRESSKRGDLFQSMFDNEKDSKRLISLCPTRWCVRAASIKRLTDTYEQVLKTLKQLSDDRNVRGDTRATIGGFLKAAVNVKTYFGLLMCGAVFAPSEDIAKRLQGENVTAQGALESVTLLIEQLQNLRSEEKMNSLYDNMVEVAEKLSLKMPEQQRIGKTPKRFRHTSNDIEEDFTGQTSLLKATLRRNFFEALDLMIDSLKKRFDQPGMEIAAKREQLLLQATHTVIPGTSVPDMDLPSNINQTNLVTQLRLLPNICNAKKVSTVTQLATILNDLHPETRGLFTEVMQLVKLILSLPISAASSERSFSALRRIRTWVRNRMTQGRLTHLALMHVHKDIVDKVDIVELMKVWAKKTPERHAVFGSF